MNEIYIFGGSFNPPTTSHEIIATTIAESFGNVIVTPCGPRPEKLTVNKTPPYHRKAMTKIAFGNKQNIKIDLSDIDNETFTRTYSMDARYYDVEYSKVWHVTGGDLFVGGKDGKSEVHGWFRGKKLWEKAHFLIITRPGFQLEPDDLPLHHQLIELNLHNSSSQVRYNRLHGLPITGMVNKKIEKYIFKNNLYLIR